MEAYFMGIDTGTQGVRIAVSDTEGNILFEQEEKWDTMFPRVGWAEQNPNVWWEKITDIFGRALSDLGKEKMQKIRAVCVCATSSTVFPVDEEGTPLRNALMWMDARSREEMDAVNRTGHPVLDYCGQETSFEWMIPKALWLKHHEPELYQSCYKLVEQLDWINYKLCRVWSSSICNTTCKWNYVSSLGGYQRDFFEQIGFEDYEDKLVTRVDKIGAPLGCICQELSEKYGFSRDMLVVQG